MRINKKNKSDYFVNILLIPYLLYVFFYDVTDYLGGARLTYMLLLVPLAGMVPVFYIHAKGTFSLCLTRRFAGWGVILCYVFFYNRAFIRGVYFDSFRLGSVLIFTYLLAHFEDWRDFCLKGMMIVGSLHVIATILFFYSNELFQQTILPLREFPPVGSVQGTEGYHSGLSAHYSLNGTYCTIMALITGAVYLSKRHSRDWKGAGRIMIIGLFWLAMIALLLTTKRAHLVFAMLSLLMVFYFTNLKSHISRMLQIFGLLMVVLALFCMLKYVDSPLAVTFQRMLEEKDDISNGRFEMWNLAIRLFLRNPLMGIGWLGYRYEYAANLYKGVGFTADGAYAAQYQYLDTHNVYLQILTETGILGFMVFMSTVLGFVLKTIKQYRKCQEANEPDAIYLAVSIGLQMFMLLYSLTGCCLNDITFLFYMLGCGFSYVTLRMKTRKEFYDKSRDINIS